MIIIEKIKSLFKPKIDTNYKPTITINRQRSYNELKGEIRAEVNRIKRE